jgi:hypothetical protein
MQDKENFVMASRTLESLVTTGYPNASADLQPLLNNSYFAARANDEIQRADAAAEAARIAAANHEDFTGITRMFAQVMAGLRDIAKRFPEVSKYTDAAVTNVQLAMQGAGNQPVEGQPTVFGQTPSQPGQPGQPSQPGGVQPPPPMLAGTRDMAKGGLTTEDIPPTQRPFSTSTASVPSRYDTGTYPSQTPTPQSPATPLTPSPNAPLPSSPATPPDQGRGPSPAGAPIPAQPQGNNFSISGHIDPSDKADGAMVQLSGNGVTQQAVVDQNGNYGFSGLGSGSYHITPQKGGVTFTPGSVDVTISAYNLNNINFGAA